MKRRGFLQACLASAAAPYVSKATGEMLEEILRQGQQITATAPLGTASGFVSLRAGWTKCYGEEYKVFEAGYAAIKPLGLS